MFDISGKGGWEEGREGVFSTSAGYHEYIGDITSTLGVCSEHQRVSMMQVGGYYDSCGRIS